MTKLRRLYPYLFITLFSCILLFIIWPSGTSFGSTTDWVQQHIKIAEYFRTLFYENGQLFPDYAPHLGGGTNIYALSYYGLFRPDILISYLLPWIKMETIIVTYILLEFLASINLCFLWLRKHRIETGICILASLFLAMSSLLFQSHRQIMFINYMPYLFCMMLATDSFFQHKKIRWISLSVFLIILHSYFFSVTAIILAFAYFCLQWHESSGTFCVWKAHKLFFKYIGGIALGIGMAAVLLLPTAYYMLNTKKDSGGNLSALEMFAITPSMKGLLYSPYGAGLTAIVLLSLLAAVQLKKIRTFGIFLLICLSSNFVAFMLNGMLYLRYKVYMVFLPLILYAFAKTMQELYHSKIRIRLSILTFGFLPIACYYLIENPDLLILLDFATAFVILCLLYKTKKLTVLYLALIIPFLLCIQTNQREDFPAEKKNDFTQSEIEQVLAKENGRFLDTTSSLLNTNEIIGENSYKTTMYSSLCNTGYNHFYYDIMRNPINIQNRVALTSSPNLLFQLFMNVKTMETKKQTLPLGYTPVAEKGNTVIAKTDDAFPTAYVTSQLYNEKAFETLSYPAAIDALLQNAVVSGSSRTDFQSSMKKEDFSFSLNGDSPKKQTVQLPKVYENTVLLLSFDVEQRDEKEVIIDINGIRNKLSKKCANYPNGNTTFTYILSSNEAIEQLDIMHSKNNFTIHNVSLYALDYDTIKDRLKELDPLITKDISKKEVLNGTVQASKDGYFVTSIPYEKGMTAYVDGQKVPVEKVNTCFVGFPIQKGTHDIVLSFHAPWKQAGLMITIFSILLYSFIFTYEEKLLWKRKQ